MTRASGQAPSKGSITHSFREGPLCSAREPLSHEDSRRALNKLGGLAPRNDGVFLIMGINDVLKSLGGALFDKEFCQSHPGTLKLCNNSVDCSARSLWQMIQFTVDELLNKVTLHHLVNPEREAEGMLEAILQEGRK